jgi:hypothetical protein
MKIKDICIDRLRSKNLAEDERYTKRLSWELKEIENQDKENYFLDLLARKVTYSENQNNLLVPYLLDIVKDFDIDQDPAFFYGDSPDIDVDFIPAARDFLKNEWAPKTFGEQHVCNIGNYTTFGIKSSLIDMVRVHGESRDQILALTTNLQTKDDEGKVLTWESAMRTDPLLNKYCEEHPEIAKAAQKLIDRNRGMGVHAGGLIVSSIPLTDLVPLVKRKDSPQASAWVEGLHGQDLQPVGLVKFDLLVISNLLQIAYCCKLINDRHGIDKICAQSGQSNWSNIEEYRNNPESLAMADEGDLKCIFQFDSPGIRSLAKAGGVTRFEDLVAYSSLYRPGPLNMKMHDRYVERKRGREEYKLHPILDEILNDTYGVIVYQEQVMKILNIVGNIPMRDVEMVRKAISKKKVEQFIKYKEIFIRNGKKNLSCTEEESEELFNQLISFSEYGFNKSVDKHTYIPTPNGLKKIRDFQKGDKVYCIDEYGNKVQTEVVNLHDHGILEGYKVIFDDGYEVICTIDHKFLTKDGQISLREILANDVSVFCEKEYGGKYAREKTIKSSLQENISISDSNAETPVKLPRVSKIGLGKWENFQISLSNRVSKNVFKRQSSKSLRRVRKYKERKYKSKEFKNKSIRRSSKSIFRCCEENIGTPRNSTAARRTSKKMEGGKPRKICKMHRSSMEKFQKIKNGSLDAVSIKMEHETNSMRKRKKASRFCKRESLDRSGWILSFLRTSKSNRKRSKITNYSTKRCNVERRMFEKKRHNVNKTKYGLLPQQHRKNENGLVGSISKHAHISNTRGLVSRKILRVVPVGKCHMYDLEVANRTHNFILPNGIVTSNSHACAYTHISARLLYLKSHFPHEFYTAILMCESDTDKIKDYRREAIKHDVNLRKIDVNVSKENFSLVGDEIYFGLSNVKGIGEPIAKEIVKGQPYKDFEDFVERFGTDASVLKPLLALRCFTDAEPYKLLMFAEKYKDYVKKNQDRKKRFHNNSKKNKEILLELIENAENSEFIKNKVANKELDNIDIDELKKVNSKTCDEWKKRYSGLLVDDKDAWKQICKMIRKMQSAKERYNSKEDMIKPKLSEFTIDESKQDKLKEEFEDLVACEKKYYGFTWQSNVEKSPDYKGGLTFDRLEPDTNDAMPVEIEVISVQKKKGKKTEYYQLKAEDANCDEGVINVWKDDYANFQNEIQAGNFLRIRLSPPSKGFKTFTIESVGPRNFYKKTTVNKEDDYRIVVLRKKEQNDSGS